MRTEQQLENVIEQYADDVRRICFVHCKSNADVDDIFQTVFLKYYHDDKEFECAAHEKAWILRVTINATNDLMRTWFRRNAVLTDDFSQFSIDPECDDGRLIIMVRKLKPNLKNTIYLHYYEGYAIKEIAQILHSNENTISTWLKRGREELKKMLGGDYLE